MLNIVSGPVHFGQIPDEHWYQPDWINETLAEEERNKMVADNTIYGGSVPCGLSSYSVCHSWF
jgi:alpha 1,2-mannosyltransferase